MKLELQVRHWYNENKRTLPWRGSYNPYLIWVSEVIMQQTRVAQGTAYFLRFLEKYPTVKNLAEAPIDEVMKLWEGLGYYSRARNLHLAAKQIVAEFNSKLPDNYTELLKIKGIGPYTAAAISSICFNERRAVVDGNVYRVLARIYGIDTPINSSAGIKIFNELASKLIKNCSNPGDYNQAMMEFGALQCVPKNPNCADCIFRNSCLAYATGTVPKLPVKIKAKPLKNRYLNYYIFQDADKIAIQKRTVNDIWAGLYQFPLLETEEAPNVDTSDQLITEPVKHILSHQRLHVFFWNSEESKVKPHENCIWVNVKELYQFPFPIVIKRFIDSNLLHL